MKETTQTQDIMQAIQFCRGSVSVDSSYIISGFIRMEGFWGAVERYQGDMIYVEEYTDTLTLKEAIKVLQSGKAILTPEAFISWKHGGVYINKTNFFK